MSNTILPPPSLSSCLTCKIKQNAGIFPFGLLSKFELLDLYGIDLPSLVETLPCFETRSKHTKLPNMSDFDIDENLISTISSRYYYLNEINKTKLTRQNFLSFTQILEVYQSILMSFTPNSIG